MLKRVTGPFEQSICSKQFFFSRTNRFFIKYIDQLRENKVSYCVHVFLKSQVWSGGKGPRELDVSSELGVLFDVSWKLCKHNTCKNEALSTHAIHRLKMLNQ